MEKVFLLSRSVKLGYWNKVKSMKSKHQLSGKRGTSKVVSLKDGKAKMKLWEIAYLMYLGEMRK